MHKVTYQTSDLSPDKDPSKYDSSFKGLLNRLRKRRNEECFKVINRGRLWYNRLSMEQYSELEIWYQAWLDVTSTLKIPEPPAWLNDKLEKEDFYL